jgi:hypothetical protein
MRISLGAKRPRAGSGVSARRLRVATGEAWF